MKFSLPIAIVSLLGFLFSVSSLPVESSSEAPPLTLEELHKISLLKSTNIITYAVELTFHRGKAPRAGIVVAKKEDCAEEGACAFILPLYSYNEAVNENYFTRPILSSIVSQDLYEAITNLPFKRPTNNKNKMAGKYAKLGMDLYLYQPPPMARETSGRPSPLKDVKVLEPLLRYVKEHTQKIIDRNGQEVKNPKFRDILNKEIDRLFPPESGSGSGDAVHPAPQEPIVYSPPDHAPPKFYAPPDHAPPKFYAPPDHAPPKFYAPPDHAPPNLYTPPTYTPHPSWRNHGSPSHQHHYRPYDSALRHSSGRNSFPHSPEDMSMHEAEQTVSRMLGKGAGL